MYNRPTMMPKPTIFPGYPKYLSEVGRLPKKKNPRRFRFRRIKKKFHPLWLNSF